MLPEWLSTMTIGEAVATVAALVIVAGGLVKTVPFLRKFAHLIDDLAGEPERPGVEARPGLMQRVASVESTLRIEVESRGEEMAEVRDRLDEVEALQLLHSRTLNEHSTLLGGLAAPPSAGDSA